jgi:hypothetical protein
MYEHGIIELGDVELADAWLRDLEAIGYSFPARAVAEEKESAEPVPQPDLHQH